MYHVGQSTKRKHRLRRVFIFALLFLVVAGALNFAAHWLRTPTVVNNSAATTTHVSVATAPTKIVKGNVFSMSIPATWKQVTTDTIYHPYSWQSTTKTDNARQIDVYVDNLPATMAFNKLQPIKANGSGLALSGDLSENCANFTDKKGTDAHTGAAPAVWSGINFYCDMANYLRNVVATGSTDGLNIIKVTGETTGAHSFLIVYTDHSAEANYDAFDKALSSFKVL